MQTRMGHNSKSNRNLLLTEVIIQIVILLLATYLIFIGLWVGVFLMLTLFIGDIVLRLTGKHLTPIIFKLVILMQALVIILYLSKLDVKNLPIVADRSKFPGMQAKSTHNNENFHPHVQRVAPQEDQIMDNKYIQTDSSESKLFIPPSIRDSFSIVEKTIGTNQLHASNFPDLKYRPREEVKIKLKRIFEELPNNGFDTNFRSPCWKHNATLRTKFGSDTFHPKEMRQELEPVEPYLDDVDGQVMTCLPLVYILGQPKCGTSDLYTRLARHPDIQAPRRKELRWFTRGEFTKSPLPPDSLITDTTSIFSFTDHFNALLPGIIRNPGKMLR